MIRRTKTVAFLLTLGIAIGITSSFLVVTLTQTTGMKFQTENPQENQNSTSDTSVGNNLSIGYAIHSLSEIPENITDVTTSESSYQQHVEISSWILALDEKRLVDLLEQSTKPSWDVPAHVRKDFQAILLSKLTTINPTRALDFALARVAPARSDFVQTIFFDWATTDLEPAVKQAKELAQELRAFALHSILQAQDLLSLNEHKAIANELGDESYATTYYLRMLLEGPLEEPSEVWAEAVELAESNEEHYQILSQIAVAWIQVAGIDVLEHMLSSVTDDSMYSAVSITVLSEVARTMPGQAFAFALDLQTKNREFVARRVVETWAEQDPHAVLEAVQAVPPSQFLSDLQFSAVLQWVLMDPRDVLARIPELPVSTRESAATEAIYLIAQDAPKEAARLVAQIEKELRWKARDVLLDSWLNQDLDAAIDWVENSTSIESEERPFLLHDLAAKVAWLDHERAFEIAQSVPLLDENNIGTEAMIIASIAQSDLSLALTLLPEVREGETQTQSYVTVASKLIERGDTQEALSLGSQLPESDLEEFFVNLAQRWAFRDIASLLSEMESFPTSEIRSKIALSLTRMNANNSRFADSQLEQLESFLSVEDRELLEINP